MNKPPPPAVDMQFSSVSSVSPSFTSHSSNNLADIAARVVAEFRNENGYEDDYDDIYNFDHHVYAPADDEPEVNYVENLKESEAESESESESEEEGEFEFAVVCTPYDSSTVSADQVFFNGEILPRYPLFDRSLLLDDAVNKLDGNSETDRISPAVRKRHPLRQLFSKERETASCSSSEADELDGVTPGTYCIWKPKVDSVENCKKSNSTGSSSKRWKFRNLIHRSNSDISSTACKDASVIVFRQLPATKKKAEKVKKIEKTAKVAGADDDGEPEIVTNEVNSANKMNKEGNRFRSYLPYKPDLVGVFANVNGLSRNLHPF